MNKNTTVYLGWQSLGRKLIECVPKEYKRVLLDNRDNISHREKNTYKVVETRNYDKYALRELAAAVRGAENICIFGGLGANDIESVVNMLEKTIKSKKFLKCCGFLVMPFYFEGQNCMNRANSALARLKKFCSQTEIYHNDKLISNGERGIKELLDDVKFQFDKIYTVILEGNKNAYAEHQ